MIATYRLREREQRRPRDILGVEHAVHVVLLEDVLQRASDGVVERRVDDARLDQRHADALGGELGPQAVPDAVIAHFVAEYIVGRCVRPVVEPQMSR